MQLIGCEVLRKEGVRLLEAAGVQVEPVWLEMGLHDQPALLAKALQEHIDRAAASKNFDAIILLYGLCSKAVVGVTARDIPLIMLRVHDCISMYLGSADRYQTEHESEPGTYWFSRGFLDRREGNEDDGGAADISGPQEYLPAKREVLYKEYCENYGEDNAEYLMETLVDGWRKNYKRVVLLADQGEDEGAACAEDRLRVRQMAEENNWRYEEREVDFRLLKMLIGGKWSEEEFLIVPPGQTIIATHDENIVGCQNCAAAEQGCNKKS